MVFMLPWRSSLLWCLTLVIFSGKRSQCSIMRLFSLSIMLQRSLFLKTSLLPIYDVMLLLPLSSNWKVCILDETILSLFSILLCLLIVVLSTNHTCPLRYDLPTSWTTLLLRINWLKMVMLTSCCCSHRIKHGLPVVRLNSDIRKNATIKLPPNLERCRVNSFRGGSNLNFRGKADILGIFLHWWCICRKSSTFGLHKSWTFHSIHKASKTWTSILFNFVAIFVFVFSRSRPPLLLRLIFQLSRSCLNLNNRVLIVCAYNTTRGWLLRTRIHFDNFSDFLDHTCAVVVEALFTWLHLHSLIIKRPAYLTLTCLNEGIWARNGHKIFEKSVRRRMSYLIRVYYHLLSNLLWVFFVTFIRKSQHLVIFIWNFIVFCHFFAFWFVFFRSCYRI